MNIADMTLVETVAVAMYSRDVLEGRGFGSTTEELIDGWVDEDASLRASYEGDARDFLRALGRQEP